MNLLTIQIEKSTLQLAEVSHKGKQILINKMRRFPLPENLINGGYTKDTVSFATFVATCIEKGKLTNLTSILLIGAPSVIHKEYTHRESNSSHLMSLANLEADTLIPENEGNFIIENEWYGPKKNKEGLQTSAIYAANEDLIVNLTKDLKANGIRLVAVFPATIVHTDLIKQLLHTKTGSREFSEKTVVAVNMSQQETRIAIFHNRELIHQRVDDLLLEEFYRKASAALQIPYDETEEYCLRVNVNRESEWSRKNPEAFEQLQEAAESMITKMARSINIVLNPEDLSLDHIIISGTPAAIPGFAEFISEGLGVPCNSIDDYYKELSKSVDLAGELKGRINLFQRVVLLAGVNYKRNKNLNFLTRGIKRKKNSRRTLLICTFILVATLLVMSIMPANYLLTYKDRNNNIAIMNSSEYIAMQELLEKQRLLKSQLQSVDAEMARLPFGDSRVADYLILLNTKLFSETIINSINYNETANSFFGEVITSDLDKFISAKNIINQEEAIRVSMPLSLIRADGLWSCQFKIELLTIEEKEEER